MEDLVVVDGLVAEDDLVVVDDLVEDFVFFEIEVEVEVPGSCRLGQHLRFHPPQTC